MRSRIPLVLSLTVCLSTLVFGQSKLPKTPRRDVVENYFGTEVADPYRWLEKTSDPEVVEWMKAQNDYTRESLAKIPGRGSLLDRIKSLDNAGSIVYNLQVWGGHYFYLKAEAGSDNRRLYVRDTASAPDRLLVDPEKLTTPDGKHFSIDYFQPSLDGKYVAYGISPGGSEDSVLHVLETSTGKVLPDVIDRAQFGQPTWLPDGKSFFIPRLQKLEPDSPPTAKYQKMRVYRHTLGSDPEKDPQVFGFDMAGNVKILEDDFAFIAYSPSAPSSLVGVVLHGVKNEKDFYVASFSDLPTRATEWKKVADDSADITGFDIHGDDLFLLSHKDASRYKVLRTSLSHPDLATATVIVPPSDVVVVNFTAAADGLYIQDLDGGIGRLRRLVYSTGKVTPLQLPFEGAIQSLFTNPTEAGAWLELTSWTKSPLWYALSANGTAQDTQVVPPSPVDFSQIESEEVKAKSADGTMVPLSIIHQRGIAMDRSHPTWLDGYGAYGITNDPTFRPTWLAFLEKGGVFAVAHVRGGGEYGEDWHNGGRLLTKQHTIDDFLACAQYLVDKKYTSTTKLAGEGTSAGGITIGGAVTQRPDLFAAALIRVGDSDSMRSELMESGPANIPEFGTVKEADGFKALYAMDAYQHVKPSTPYPAILLTTGVNDPRVAPWQAAKMAARLQASTTSGKPILLRVDYDAGHGLGSTKSQRDEELADELAFLFWQFGVAGYQPK
ncbi:MAG TPA: prolyl oligopeptidase family serine peptidase [Candidatus Binatia bacterium]|nr:prolyl oligopeptidase family serine peptidase [Candidatus Binatia bacterium]